MTAYKVLSKNMTSCHGGRKKWTPGKRHSVRGELVPCKNGLHICRDERDLLSWPGEVICPVVEHSGEYVDAGNKRVVRWCIIGEPIPWWDERTARHFSCDCAEYALRYADEPDQELLQSCIDIIRAYADWPEEWKQEREAALDAAWAAIWAATWVAREAALDAAWAAARAASRAASWDAAWAAARAASAASRAASWDDLAAILATYLDGTNEWVKTCD